MVQLFVLEALLMATAVVLYGVEMSLAGLVEAFVTMVVATIGLACVGTLYGGLAAGARGRETLLPLLLLPVVAPVLIGATRATEAAFESGGTAVSEGWPWVGLLAVFAMIFAVVGTVAFGPLVDE
jgi:heme exporter protein B